MPRSDDDLSGFGLVKAAPFDAGAPSRCCNAAFAGETASRSASRYANPKPAAGPVLTLVQGSANKNVLTVPADTNTCASVVTIAAAQRTIAATYDVDTGIRITSP